MKAAEEKTVSIPIEGVELEGILAIPEGTKALVVFVHGSGSSRLSPRNNFVADKIRDKGMGTLLFDLLTEKEDETYQTRFDIELLVNRLIQVLDWLHNAEETKDLYIGLFGSSTGAAAALRVAAQKPDKVSAIVSRGGRTDLAGEFLADVLAPTLFIVGRADEQVLLLNRESYESLGGPKELSVIEGATHLFEESGTLERVADLAAQWFSDHLRKHV